MNGKNNTSPRHNKNFFKIFLKKGLTNGMVLWYYNKRRQRDGEKIAGVAQR